MKLCSKDECTGCTICSCVCPFGAIEMKENERGFKYPIINEAKCKKCGLCDKVTSNLNSWLENSEHTKKYARIYAVKNKDENKRKESQSGGFFYSLAEVIIESGGVVYGAAYNDNLDVEHIKASDIETLNKIRGSKYVQSDLKNCMSEVIEDLNNNKKVLFSGTPCQIAAIETLVDFKKINKDNLFTCDIICHGVPSPKIYRSFLEFLEKKYNSNAIDVNLRNKKISGWHNYVETVKFANGKTYKGKIYADLFFSNLCLRRSCEQCKYTKENRPGDITCADCWGIEKIKPNLWNDDNGISLVLIQTNKGNVIFNSVQKKLDVVGLNDEEYNQPQLNHSTNTPKLKRKFWNDYSKKDFEKVLKKYTIYGGNKFKLKRKVLKKLKKW